MARRLPTAEPEPVEDLAWRLRWLLRSTLASTDQRWRDEAVAEAGRSADLPLPDRVRRMERFLEARGLLEHAERKIGSLLDARERWRTQ